MLYIAIDKSANRLIHKGTVPKRLTRGQSPIRRGGDSPQNGWFKAGGGFFRGAFRDRMSLYPFPLLNDFLEAEISGIPGLVARAQTADRERRRRLSFSMRRRSSRALDTQPRERYALSCRSGTCGIGGKSWQ